MEDTFVWFGIIGVSLGFGAGAILQIYWGLPYRLEQATTEQKRRWVIILAGLHTLPALAFLPLLLIMGPPLLVFTVCIASIVIAFPVAILWKRWDLERELTYYRKLDKFIRQPTTQNLYRHAVFQMFSKCFLNNCNGF